MLASDGVVNQLLTAVGLGASARGWLGDFDFALPAVGIIGAWVLLGLCTMLLVTGITKIDPSLYEAAKLDGASAWHEFVWITLPGLRQEIGVCVTVTVIAALASFDIVYIATGGGPGPADDGARARDLSPGLRPPAGRARLGARGRPHGAGDRLHPADPVVHAEDAANEATARFSGIAARRASSSG